MTLHFTIQQLNNWLCNCNIHHHYMAYLCECLTIISEDNILDHQAKNGCQKKIEFGSVDYNHNSTPDQLWDKLLALGTVHSQPDFDYFYKKFAEKEVQK